MSRRRGAIIAAAGVLGVIGVGCQPPPPPRVPHRVTMTATLERDVEVGHFPELTHMRGMEGCEPEVIERDLTVRYVLIGDPLRYHPNPQYVRSLVAGSKVVFTTWDHPDCVSPGNITTHHNGRSFTGPMWFMQVSSSSESPDEFISVPYYDGVKLTK